MLQSFIAMQQHNVWLISYCCYYIAQFVEFFKSGYIDWVDIADSVVLVVVGYEWVCQVDDQLDVIE